MKQNKAARAAENHVLLRQLIRLLAEASRPFRVLGEVGSAKRVSHQLTGKRWRRSLALAGVMLTCWLFARTSEATSYTWIGTTSSDWTTTGNWSSLGFPNAYTDTAADRR